MATRTYDKKTKNDIKRFSLAATSPLFLLRRQRLRRCSHHPPSLTISPHLARSIRDACPFSVGSGCAAAHITPLTNSHPLPLGGRG
ncbi:MAG: hypothetical protein IKQ77_11935 [Prevotella sp.]|nr:hypothetical protein [Prevotella sp.]